MSTPRQVSIKIRTSVIQLLNNGRWKKTETIPMILYRAGEVLMYTRKNAQVATDLQTCCNKPVHKLLTRCIRTACFEFVRTSLEQAVDKL